MKRFYPFPFLSFLLQFAAFWVQTSVAQAQDCPAPTAYNNSENYSVNSAYLQWDGGAQATQFTLEIRTTRETSWSSIAAGATRGYSVTGLTPRTNYVWRVKADCSPFSNTATVSTDFCGAYSMQARPQSNSATLEWRSQLNTIYNLSWRPEGGTWTTVNSLTGNTRFSSSIPRYSLSAAYSLTGLFPNTVYEWKVEAVCGPGYTQTSPSVAFTANCNSPTSVTTTSVGNDYANVTWQSIYRPSDGIFVVQYRLKEPSNSQWISTTSVSNYFYANRLFFFTNLLNLNSGAEYEVRVQGQCADGTFSELTTPISFFTTVPPCHTSMDTIRPGLWTDPIIWSCGRVPVPSDPVYVMHDVLIPDNAIGRAHRVFYGFGGQVRLGTGAKLLLDR